MRFIFQAISVSLFLAFSSFASAYVSPTPDSKVVYSGHNVTQTAWVYPKGRCTFGTQLAGCGLTEKLTLATSPWLSYSYNMINANVRYQLSARDTLAKAVQLGYFRTYKTGRKLPAEADPNSPIYDSYYCYYAWNKSCFTGYEMDAAWLYFAQSERVSSTYNLHWNVSVAYYWNDKKPFSLRRPQKGDSPWQVNLMTLHEFHMSGPWYLQGELGILGVQRKYPPFHSGASLSYRTKRWLAQFGFSATGSLDSWLARNRRDYHSEALEYPNGLDEFEYSDYAMRTDFSIHPELLIQYFFDL